MNWILLTIITLTLANPFSLGIAKLITDGTTTAQLDKVLIQEMSDNPVTEILGPDGGRITACGEAYVEMEAGFLKENTVVTIECSDEPLTYPSGKTDDVLEQYEPIADKATVSFKASAINAAGLSAEDYPDLSAENYQGVFTRIPATVEAQGVNSVMIVLSLDGEPIHVAILQYSASPLGTVSDVISLSRKTLLRIPKIADAQNGTETLSISYHPYRLKPDFFGSRTD